MKGIFYLHYATRSLRRNGQRTLLAILCVAFGAMSLVALQIVSSVLADANSLDPRLILGGDVQIYRAGRYLTASDITELDSLQDAGFIQDYTTFTVKHGQMLKRENTGRVYFLARALGVDPKHYPLQGEVIIGEPGGMTLFEALSEARAAAVTYDLAHRLHLSIGDSFVFSGERGNAPERLYVKAIIQSTPDRFGDAVYYSLETARILAGRPDVATYASLRWGLKGEAMDQLSASGWNIRTPEQVLESNKRIREFFDLSFKGAGILGLLVGGIGIANTMQVVLARRTLEIATLKTLGYSQWDLMTLLGLETALLGLVGSVLGVAAATALSTQLLRSITRMGALLVEWSAEPRILAGGVLVGTVTAEIFGVYAILRASAVRPAVMLRNLPVRSTWRRRLQALGVYAVLAVPFAMLCSLILRSVLYGIATIGVALAGLVVLGLLLGGALFIVVRLPMPRARMLRIARNNLRRHGARTVFALIALFAGVFAIGLAVAAILSARDEFAARSASNEGYNLLVLSAPTRCDQVIEQLGQQTTDAIHMRYQVPLQLAMVHRPNNGTPQALNVFELEGRADGDATWDLEFTGEAWGTVSNAAYLPTGRVPDTILDTVDSGSIVTVVNAQDLQRDLIVAGLYSAKEMGDLVEPPRGILVSKDLALELGGPQARATFVIQVPENELGDVTETLGRALPDAIVVSLGDLNDAMQRMLKNLLIFVVSVAGLALLAGAILIANAVGLAMVERRREVGILKAVGFSRSDVLRTFLLEHGMLGLLAGVKGTMGVVVAIEVFNTVESRAGLTFHLLPGLGIMLLSVIIALASATLVAWHPTLVRPMVVLRDE